MATLLNTSAPCFCPLYAKLLTSYHVSNSTLHPTLWCVHEGNHFLYDIGVGRYKNILVLLRSIYTYSAFVYQGH